MAARRQTSTSIRRRQTWSQGRFMVGFLAAGSVEKIESQDHARRRQTGVEQETRAHAVGKGLASHLHQLPRLRLAELLRYLARGLGTSKQVVEGGTLGRRNAGANRCEVKIDACSF